MLLHILRFVAQLPCDGVRANQGTALAFGGEFWLNWQRSARKVCKINNKRFASFGRCPSQNWHFDQKAALEARPHRACRKRSFEGTPVPVRERE
jgi:hypothetical protein